jgi:uncharacterized protein (DUF433 family)
MAELLGFTAEHISCLTRLSKRQLVYWDRTGFFSPAHKEAGRTYGRVYTFRDLVALKVISVLRVDHHLPLQELRRVGEWLHRRYAEPWSRLRFGVSGRTVIFLDPNTHQPIEARGQGQQIMAIIEMQEIANEMIREAKTLQDRTTEIGQITKRRQVASSAWIVAGTRIHTSAIWNFHEAGYDTEAILREYPSLQPEDVRAAIKFEEKRRAA